MIHFNSLQSLFPQDQMTTARMINLKVGDILNGQVLKLFSDNLALVQLGGMKLSAKLTTPLTENTKYWFQVVDNNSFLELKVMDDVQMLKKEIGKGQGQDFFSLLLKKIGLAGTEGNKELISMFLTEDLPLSKEAIKAASEWVREINKVDLPKALAAIKLAINKELPLTETVLKSMLALQTDEPMSDHLVKVSEAIKTIGHPSDTITQLQKILGQLTGQTADHELLDTFSKPIVNWNNEKEVLKTIKQLVHQMGLEYEVDISLLEKDPSIESKLVALKPLLIKAAAESSNPLLNVKIEELLSRITGLQLMNTEQAGQLQQVFLQLPIILGPKATDLLVQWTGKRRITGQIDPDFCRILFYLELEQLRETLVDVHVQKRIVTIQIYNDTPCLDIIVKKFRTLLKDKLEGLHYHLSGIVVSPRERNVVDKMEHFSMKTNSVFPSSMNGVDVKI